MKSIIRLVILLCLALPVYGQQPTYKYPPPVIHWRVAVTPTEVREFLSHSHSLREWNRNVAKIVELNNGKLPSFWQHEIIDSQFFKDLAISWGQGLAQEP